MTRLLENKWLLLVAGFILLVLLFTGLYYFLLYPLQNKIALKETELANEERLLTTINLKKAETKTISFESTTELQKKLPVKPLTDQFVRDLEKAEVVSNSEIVSMTFSESDVTVPETKAVKTTDTTTSTTESSQAGEKAAAAAPYTDLKKVVATLSVKSPSYKELTAFLDSILSMRRISNVDSLTFTGNEEIILLDQEMGELEYQLVVSVFYYPALTDLQDQIPVIETPKPSGKKIHLVWMKNRS